MLSTPQRRGAHLEAQHTNELFCIGKVCLPAGVGDGWALAHATSGAVYP